MTEPARMRPRLRVISDNDYSGDPDGIAQLAHHALSPSVELRLVIGSRLRPGDPFDPSPTTARNAASIAREILDLAGRTEVAVLAGSDVSRAVDPAPSAAARAIIAEAMREDTELPLVLCCGAGLTEAAAALRLEPRIAERMLLIWIGGPEHPGLAAPPPGAMPIEYNLLIDIGAAREVFDSHVQIWQVPRDAYRQTLVSLAELRRGLSGGGELGARLLRGIDATRARIAAKGLGLGETYVMGDSPLVLLTALLSSFEPDASSSASVLLPTPRIDADGRYVPRDDGRPLRVFTRIDTRLMVADLFAKLADFAERRRG